MSADLDFIERELRSVAENAWESRVSWPEIKSWTNNFTGEVLEKPEEKMIAMYALSRFMFFSQRLVREMLISLYRDHFRAPMRQKIRARLGDSATLKLVDEQYAQELRRTRFVGVGNPSESGAHLLYYFRQVNRLEKDLFADCGSAFTPISAGKNVLYFPREKAVTRFVFFDDLVGSFSQCGDYLGGYIEGLRESGKEVELRFMSLFATSQGLRNANASSYFDGHATSLFELDESFQAFSMTARYFSDPPSWFSVENFRRVFRHYGEQLQPSMPLGYQDGQLLLGFSHNTPDNTLPVVWDEGSRRHWNPIFLRYDKNYGKA